MRHELQKYSDWSLCGFARHWAHTGIRLTSRRGVEQIRHSSGKTIEKKSAQIFSIEASVALGADVLVELLLKIHPHIEASF